MDRPLSLIFFTYSMKKGMPSGVWLSSHPSGSGAVSGATKDPGAEADETASGPPVVGE